MTLVLEVDQNFPQPGIVEHAIEVLKEKHGIIVYPTDTIYGIGCDAHDKVAVEKLSEIKNRDADKKYSLMFKDLAQLKKYTKLNETQEKILAEFLPGPFTFIVPVGEKTPKHLGLKDKIGVRIPRNRLCRALVQELKKPIITTSLNVSGKPVITSISNIPKSMVERVDIILDADELGDQASTVVDITGDSPVVLRQGKGIFK